MVAEMVPVQSGRGLGLDRNSEVKKSMCSKHIFLSGVDNEGERKM